MTRSFVFFLATLAAPAALGAPPPVDQFSADCRSWKPLGKAEAADSGYVKSGSDIIYFDFSKNLWIETGKRPIAFIEQSGDVFVLRPDSIESHALSGIRDNSASTLMRTISDIAQETAKQDHWTLRMKLGHAELAAVLMGPKRCSLEPDARLILCKASKPCFLAPKAKEREKNARACAKELGLLEASKLSRFSRACDVLGDETIYKAIEEGFAEIRSACHSKKTSLPRFDQIKAMCVEAKALLTKI